MAAPPRSSDVTLPESVLARIQQGVQHISGIFPDPPSARPAREEQRDFWTEHQPGFRFTDAAIGTPEFYREVEEHRYRLEPAVPTLARFFNWSGKDVLDAGCGIATDGINFARAGASYTGIDFSPSALSLAERRFNLEGKSGRFVAGSIVELPFDDGAFDLVYSNGVIHHLQETEQAVSEMHRVLRPGGVAIVMVYHRDSLNYRFTVMLLRRALVGLLLVPGMATVAARVTGERSSVLEGQRNLLQAHGLRYLLDRQLFLSNNTDGPGNPLSKVYSRRDAYELFSAFRDVRLNTRFLNLRIYPGGDVVARMRPARKLEQHIGWHLWIEAYKHQ